MSDWGPSLPPFPDPDPDPVPVERGVDGLLVIPAAPSLPPTVLDGDPAGPAPPDGIAPLGAETPEFPLADALAMLAEALETAEADETIEELTADASATGQTVWKRY